MMRIKFIVVLYFHPMFIDITYSLISINIGKLILSTDSGVQCAKHYYIYYMHFPLLTLATYGYFSAINL
jgi:hypothetical protein